MRRAALLVLAACAQPALVLEAPPAPVGFDADFVITARVDGGELSFRQIDGPPLDIETSGPTLRGRTHSLAALRPGPLPWGIIPFSPATQGAYTFEATWRRRFRAPVVATARVLAAARATGVPSLTVGTPVHLGGEGWRIDKGPPGAELVSSTFVASRTGRWQLVDGEGRTLLVRAARHDETPLDCGRAECHPQAAEAVKTSPMTRVLHDGLEGLLGDRYDARCALACHAVGEPGVADGGFADVAARLGFAIPARARWASLPRPLRHLGGVGCTACHGPAAIPEEGARWSILAADVCAVCHDAPPRYALVAAWRASRMARADADPATQAERCRACHTTGGYLDAAGVRPLTRLSPRPLGIACAACHAPHSARLRDVPLPASLGADLPPAARASAACLRCHAPLDGAGAEGSAAALWLGRGGVRVDDGGPLRGEAPHAEVPCAGCHDGVGHTFRARPEACAPCHREPPAVDDSIAARAARLAGRGRHPAPPPGSRAAWNVALVLEDPAAAVHNASYARALLDEAER